MKAIRFIALSAIFFVLTDCRTHLTSEVIEEHGTHVFESDKSSVFEAVKATLTSRDFEIEIEKQEEGYIKTKQKLVSVPGATTPSYKATYQHNYRVYIANIEDIGEGKVKVVLTPLIYTGETNSSSKKIWALKGSKGEIAIWDSLFKDIEERL